MEPTKASRPRVDSARCVRHIRSPELNGSELTYVQSWDGAAPPDVRPQLEVRARVTAGVLPKRAMTLFDELRSLCIRSIRHVSSLCTNGSSSTPSSQLSIAAATSCQSGAVMWR